MKKLKLKFQKNGEDQEDYYTKSTDGRPFKIQWQKPHEASPRELWKNNTIGKNFQSARYRKDKDYYNDPNKRHHSLPVPPRNQVEKPKHRDIVVDSRRFGVVDPLVFSGKTLTMDDSTLDIATYLAQEIQKEEEKRKQRESREVDNNSERVNTVKSVGEEGIRSRRESQQSVRRDDRVSRRENQQSVRGDQKSVRRDDRAPRRENQQSVRVDQKSVRGDDKTSRRESQQSVRVDQKSVRGDDKTSRRESQQSVRVDQKSVRGDDKTSRRESQQTVRRDDRTYRRESQQSIRGDDRTSYQESQQSIRDSRTSHQESLYSVRRDSGTSHQESLYSVRRDSGASHQESLYSVRRDSGASHQESLYSVRRDSGASHQESLHSVRRDSGASHQESLYSVRRDSRASHRESNVDRLPSTPEHEEVSITSSTSISGRPPLPKKSPSRYRERKVSGICSTCRGSLAEGGYCIQWCHSCESRKFEKKFGTWTSGNDVIDTLILESQLSANSRFDYLEWIPFDRFKDVQLIGSGGIGSVYQAIWLDGPREKWDKKIRQYVRCGEWRIALRSLDNSENLASNYFDELKAHLHCENNSGNYVTRCYGITQDTKTKDYMIVVQYARNGNLRKYMNKNSVGITWKRRLDILYGVVTGLHRIHRENIVHRNLHSGNVLINSYMTLISDLGIYNRADNYETDGTFGILPYVAPEILRAKPLTTAADIYSLGTIMWELAFGRKPFGNRAHDLELATNIVNGLRPEIIEEIPKCYLELMKSCWDSDPFKRPSAEKLYCTLGEWLCKVYNVPKSEVAMQFAEAEKRRLESIKQGTKSSATPDQIESPIQSPTHSSFNNIGENIHSDADFKSRFLKFESLQEPTIMLFTRTYRSREHLALKEYLTAETESYNSKYEMMQADNTEIAAEIYEIMQYW